VAFDPEFFKTCIARRTAEDREPDVGAIFTTTAQVDGIQSGVETVDVFGSNRLASRLPPRLRQWRTVLPEEAGMEATPYRRAKDASLLSLWGVRGIYSLGPLHRPQIIAKPELSRTPTSEVPRAPYPVEKVDIELIATTNRARKPQNRRVDARSGVRADTKGVFNSLSPSTHSGE
jgi:hypothetical protein